MLVTLSCPTLCAPWTTWLYVAYQSLLSMEFSRQEYWSGKRFLSLGDLPNPGIEPGSLALQADSLPSELPGKTCVLLKLSKGLRTLGCRFIFSGFLPWKWKSLSHVRLCDPMDYTVNRILQARLLEWVAIPFSRGSSQLMDRTQVSHIAGGFCTSWATSEAQEYQCG